MEPTTGFSFSQWHPHLEAWALLGGIGIAYLVALRVLGPRLAPPDRPAATRFQKASFFAGLVALWIGADWPVHDLSEDFLFSIHMVQHTLFSLVAPPLLLLGTPAWLLRKILGPKWLWHPVRFVTRPFVALLLFNGVILVTHWPVIVDMSLLSEPVHFAVHLVLVSTSLAMWCPVIAPLPELARLSEPGKMLYLFLQSVLPTVPASFLTFASSPIYSFYADVPRIWGIDVITDLRISGLIMKLGGGLLLWFAIAVLFFKWNAREERQQVQDVSWDDFERELEVFNMRSRRGDS